MRIVGSILCIAAIILAFGLLSDRKLDGEQKIQEWALFAVLLTIGIALSRKKKPDDTKKQ
jgi:hypothetical protein